MPNPMLNTAPSIADLLNALRCGSNPQRLAENILSNNPQIANDFNALRNQCGTNSPRDFVLNYCSKNGVDMNAVNSLAHMLGLK